MKMLKSFLKVLMFFVGAAAAAWIFMPWQQIGEAALISAGSLPGASGISWSAVRAVKGGFAADNLDVKMYAGMAGLSCRSFTVVPDLVSSVMNVAPACRISFTGGVLITPSIKAGTALGDGRVTAALFSQGIMLEELRSNGELSINGTMLLSPSSDRIIHQADVVMDVKSELFEEKLPDLQRLLELPMRQEAPGRWVLHRTAGSAQ